MIRTTPLHRRTQELNETGLYSHWAGFLSAEKYQLAEKFEYFAIRNSVGIFDTSPLYKYRIDGSGAEKFLSGVLARDIRRCGIGQSQYTIWCDDDGFVCEDGLITRLGQDDYFLTTARPNLAYFQDLARKAVGIRDVSEGYAGIALAGPRSRHVLEEAFPGVADLSFFAATTIDESILSRTGFTGDLGYELWVPADDALNIWDRLIETGQPHGITPFGQIALDMARIEAGLILIEVDFQSARFAWTQAEKSTPVELGLGWMLSDFDRPFIGRNAMRREITEGTSRYEVIGLMVDWEDWDRLFNQARLIPTKNHVPSHAELMVYTRDSERVGWASSFMYSPMLQRHIALARVRPDLAIPGTTLDLELTVDHEYQVVRAVVAPLPFYDPPRKRANQ